MPHPMCCFFKKRRRNEIISLLRDIRGALRRLDPTAARLIFSAQVEGHPQQKGIKDMTLTDAQKVSLTIQPIDSKGNAATLPTPAVWTSSDETVLTVVAAADGLTAVATAVGPLGKAQVTVKAQPDVDLTIPEIVGTLDVEVVGSDAVSLSIKADAPTAQ